MSTAAGIPLTDATAKMPKKKGGGKRKAAETPEEKAMRLEMERIKAIEDEIHRAGARVSRRLRAQSCMQVGLN